MYLLNTQLNFHNNSLNCFFYHKFIGGYIEINIWSFPYQPRYHPETPISAQNAVEGLYESGEDSRDDMEKVMY